LDIKNKHILFESADTEGTVTAYISSKYFFGRGIDISIVGPVTCGQRYHPYFSCLFWPGKEENYQFPSPKSSAALVNN